MAAALILSVLALGLLVAALAGSDKADASVGRVFALGLPVLVIAGATVAPFGYVLWSVVLVSLAVIAGIVLAGRVGPQLDALSRNLSGPNIGVLVARSAVAVILAGVAVRWLAPIIRNLTNLSAVAVAIVGIGVAIALVAFGGGRFGLARAALIIGAVLAVLALVGGLIQGKPGSSFRPLFHVEGPSIGGLLMALAGAILIAAVHPGLSAQGRESANALVRGAVATGLIGIGVLLGLVWLFGGSLTFPSMQLQSLGGYVAFAPSLLGAIVAGLAFTVMVILVASALESVLEPWRETNVQASRGWLNNTWVAPAVAGLATLGVALSPLSGGWWLGTALAVSLLTLALAALSMRASGESPAELVARAPAST